MKKAMMDSCAATISLYTKLPLEVFTGNIAGKMYYDLRNRVTKESFGSGNMRTRREFSAYLDFEVQLIRQIEKQKEQ